MRAYLKAELEQFLEAVDAALDRPADRAYEHDLEVIAEIHARFPLELETLAGRFEAEMSPIGDRIRIRGNFLAVVERIFPSRVDLVAQRLERVR